MSDFQTVFFVHQIKGFSSLLSKKNLNKINLRVRFLPLKIAFFWGFERDNILSSKSYTKARIFAKFETYVHKMGLYHQIFFRKDPCTHTRVRVINARTHVLSRARAHVYGLYAGHTGLWSIRGVILKSKTFFRKDQCTQTRVRQNICACVYDLSVRVRARIFTKKNLVVKSCLMNLSLKFRAFVEEIFQFF